MREPRLGLFREGDTVDDARRRELMELPQSGNWIFMAAKDCQPHPRTGSTIHMKFQLKYVGSSR